MLVNKHHDSDISTAIIKDRVLFIHKKDLKEEVFNEESIADVLNYTSGISTNNHRFMIDKNLEKQIYLNFLDAVWRVDKPDNSYFYIYTGEVQTNKKALAIQEEKRRQVLESYKIAPKNITLVNIHETKDETGKIWPLGIAKMHMILDAKKINGSTEQARLNIAVCNAARIVNNSTNFKYPRVEDGSRAITGVLTDDFDQTNRFEFKLKPNIKPSAAIKRMFAPLPSPLIIECTMAIHLVEHKALLEFMGEAEFDKSFSNTGMIISRSSVGNPVLKYRKQFSHKWDELPENQQEFLDRIVPGDILYIRNIEQYLKRNAFGESIGHNVVYLGRNEQGEQEFAGLFTIKKIRTYKEIIDLLVDDYNEIPHYIKESENGLECIKPKLGGYC